jgi:hypothetical protein
MPYRSRSLEPARNVEIIPPADTDKVLREQFEWMMVSGAGASWDEMRRFRLIRELLLAPFSSKAAATASSQKA